MTAAALALKPGLAALLQGGAGRKFLLMAAAAAVIAAIAGVALWGQKPDYKVLFANVADRDGGAIVAELTKQNVPYRFSEGGGAILVPADLVHEARLKLASMGLPKGGNVGFELLENQRLGTSQFVEQVNYQRALEGELARSIQALAAVESARVHLALPKASVFVRDQQKPTASVLVNLRPGRVLDAVQVSAVEHLVASSIPEMPAGNVTVVDQNGRLLSHHEANPAANGLDETQLKYVQGVEQAIEKRIESIISPIVGPGNVRAEVTAEIDFSRSEQAAESYKPNQTPESAAVRSQQLSETRSAAGSAAGVPGALSNQPPAPATAPLTQPAAPSASGAGSAPERKDSTVNYEVDKTVRYTQQGAGGIRRLSVAVVVNYRKDVDKAGKPISRPLSDA